MASNRSDMEPCSACPSSRYLQVLPKSIIERGRSSGSGNATALTDPGTQVLNSSSIVPSPRCFNFVCFTVRTAIHNRRDTSKCAMRFGNREPFAQIGSDDLQQQSWHTRIETGLLRLRLRDNALVLPASDVVQRPHEMLLRSLEARSLLVGLQVRVDELYEPVEVFGRYLITNVR